MKETARHFGTSSNQLTFCSFRHIFKWRGFSVFYYIIDMQRIVSIRERRHKIQDMWIIRPSVLLFWLGEKSDGEQQIKDTHLKWCVETMALDGHL